MLPAYKFSLTPVRRVSAREKVERLEALLCSVPQVECPVKNYFSNGLYIREMTLPAGTTLTGAVHKTKHMVTVKGVAKVHVDDGVIEVDGFAGFIAHPGAKRAFHAITETVITNFHETTETDLDKLIEELTESKACELLGESQNKQLMANKLTELEA